MKNLSNYESIPVFHDKASVKAYINNNGVGFSPHWHEHMELFYFLEGKGLYTCNGNTYSVKAGDMIVVNSAQIHTLTDTSSIRFGCILFYPSFFWDISLEQSVPITNFIQGDSFIQEQCEKIFSEQTAKPYGYDVMIKGLSTTLLGYLIRHYPAKQNKSRGTSTEQLKKEHLLFDYIAKHYRENLTTADLARFCHVTESYFCRFFKKHFGRTPTTYLNEYRIDKAIQQLRNTQDSITAIALESGFMDISYFTKTFKKIMGVTPKEFRRQFTNAT